MIHVLDALEYYSKMDIYAGNQFAYIKIIVEFYKLNIVFDQYHGASSEDLEEHNLKMKVSKYSKSLDGYD